MDFSQMLESIDKEENIYKRRWYWFLLTLYYRYLKLKMWLWDKNFNKLHISYGIVNGKFQITSTRHQDYIKATQKRINDFAKTNSTADFIEYALKEALEGCNFIIFDTKPRSDYFVQFWTDRKSLEFDFVANKKNRLKKFYYGVLGVLADNALTPREVRRENSYITYKEPDQWGIQAKMGNNTTLAANCVETIFKNVYKIKDKKLIAKVE